MIGGELGGCAVRGILRSRVRYGEGRFVDVCVLSHFVDVRMNVTTDSIFPSQGVNTRFDPWKWRLEYSAVSPWSQNELCAPHVSVLCDVT
jgi:hypothetical protein